MAVPRQYLAREVREVPKVLEERPGPKAQPVLVVLQVREGTLGTKDRPGQLGTKGLPVVAVPQARKGLPDTKGLKETKGLPERPDPKGLPEPEGLPEQKGLLEPQGRLGTLDLREPRERRGIPPHRSTVCGPSGKIIPIALSLAAQRIPALRSDLAASRSIRRTAARIAKEKCSRQGSAT